MKLDLKVISMKTDSYVLFFFLSFFYKDFNVIW